MAAGMEKLPLGVTIKGAYGSVFNDLKTFVEAAWLPIILQLALGFILPLLLASYHASHNCPSPDAISAGTPPDLTCVGVDELVIWGWVLISLPIFAMVPVAWHRLILLREAPKPAGGFATPGRLWLYGWVGLMITLLGTLIALPIVIVSVVTALAIHGGGPGEPAQAIAANSRFAGLLSVPFVVAAIYLMSRRSLTLPGIAIGDRADRRKAVRLQAKGSFWRMFAGLFVCTAPIPALALGLRAVTAGFPTQFGVSAADLVLQPLAGITGALAAATGAAFLSLAYRFFSGRLANAPAA